MIELVFVVVILGILAAIALPNLSSSKDVAEKGVLEANMQAVQAMATVMRNECIIKSLKSDTTNYNSSNCFPKNLNFILSRMMQMDSKAKNDLITKANYHDNNGTLSKK